MPPPPLRVEEELLGKVAATQTVSPLAERIMPVASGSNVTLDVPLANLSLQECLTSPSPDKHQDINLCPKEEKKCSRKPKKVKKESVHMVPLGPSLGNIQVFPETVSKCVLLYQTWQSLSKQHTEQLQEFSGFQWCSIIC